MEEVLRFAQLFKSIEDKIIEKVQNGADPVKAHEGVRYDLMTKAGYKPNYVTIGAFLSKLLLQSRRRIFCF